MAKKSALTDEFWLAVETDFRIGDLSNDKMAVKHGISEAYIRKRAKAKGWVKNPTKSKRELVQAALAGFGTDRDFKCDTRTLLQDSANQDIADMGIGLSNARLILAFINVRLSPSDPKKEIEHIGCDSLKKLAETNRIAIETIREIRGLKEPPPEAEELDLSNVPDEALADAERAYERLKCPVESNKAVASDGEPNTERV